ADQNLQFAEANLGRHIVSVTTSDDRERAFVISRGDSPRLRPTDQGPALTVIAASNPTTPIRYELPDELTSLALDPEGRFAIVYTGDSDSGGFITNPNELLIVDLSAAPSATNPSQRNLPSSIGGAPKRITFTEPLHLPAGDRRLIVVETDRDLVLA